MMLFLAQVVHADQDAALIINDVLGVSRRALAVLVSVKDQPSAAAAKGSLENLGKEFDAKIAAFEKLTDKTQREIGAQRGQEFKAVRENLDKECIRISRVPEIMATLGKRTIVTATMETQIRSAKAAVKALSSATDVFYLRFADYPPSLEALTTKEPDGAPALIQADSLTDPWGHPYQYAPMGKKNEFKPDIWTTSPYGNGKSLIGNWPEKR
jgi:hypothetical protein